MTRFLDVRIAPVGGNLSPRVAVNQGTTMANYAGMDIAQLVADITGQDVLICAHGFNVDRANGIANLSNWEQRLQLPMHSIFVGLLWPGDSTWAHGLDYPGESPLANDAGRILAPFIEATFPTAASISFVSHSLGARVVLATASLMRRRIRSVMLMAGAIEDDCLNKEFKAAVANIGDISVLASASDDVLSKLFPLGNFFARIFEHHNPFGPGALGGRGPASPWPTNFRPPFQIPDTWVYEHGDYLRIAQGPVPFIPLPAIVPPNGSQCPAASDWQSEWSAAIESTRFAL